MHATTMPGLLSNAAAKLRLRDEKNKDKVPADRQEFFPRLAPNINRGKKRPPAGWAGLLLSNPTQVFSAVGNTIANPKNNGVPNTAISYLRRISGRAAETELRLNGDPASLQLALLVHGLTAFGHDTIALAAHIGQGCRVAAALGVDGEVVLPGRRWQSQNAGARSAVMDRFIFEGRAISQNDIVAGLDRNRLMRDRFYSSVGLRVNRQDPGETVDEQGLSAMVDELFRLSLDLAGKALADEQRQNPRIAFLELLANTTGRTDNKMPALDRNRIWYYVIQTIVQSYYLGQDTARVIKISPPTEGAFDDTHSYDLEPGQFINGCPGTCGSLAHYYDRHYCLAGKQVLPYSWFSRDVIATAKREAFGPGNRDVTQLQMDVIPLGKTQTVGDISEVLRRTDEVDLAHLYGDLLSFLLACQSRQPDNLRVACKAAGLIGGMTDLLDQLGGKPLTDGWNKSLELTAGPQTLAFWVDWFNSFDSDSSNVGPVPPHFWPYLKHEWSEQELGLLALLAVVIRNYYLAVTAG